MFVTLTQDFHTYSKQFPGLVEFVLEVHESEKFDDLLQTESTIGVLVCARKPLAQSSASI